MNSNLKLVQDIYAAFGQGDIPGILNRLHADVSWEFPGPRTIPFAGIRKGTDDVAAWFGVISDQVEFLDFAPEEFCADGNLVISIGRERARSKRTGKVFETAWTHVWTIRDGKVARLRDFLNTAALAEAFSA